MSVTYWNLLSFPILKLAPKALICALALLTGCLQLSAQSTQEIDLAEFDYAVTVSGGMLNANETATVTLTLGNEGAPLSDVVAIRLELTLSDNAYLPPSSLQASVQGSWVYDPAAYSTSLSVNTGAHSLSLTLTRSSGTADGHGFAFSFPLVVCCNGVNASSLVLSDGGVVIVDNIDMRMADPRLGETADPLDRSYRDGTPAPVRPALTGDALPGEARTPDDGRLGASLGLYPNPCHGQVRFRLTEPAAATLRLTGMDGQVHTLPVNHAGGIGIADIDPLPRGWYVAELLESGKVRIRQRLLLD